MREDFGDVSVMRSPGVDLEDRAARMNEFWKALVEFHDRDVLVVALCVGDKSKRAVPRLSAITPRATELLRCGERRFVPLGAIGVL